MRLALLILVVCNMQVSHGYRGRNFGETRRDLVLSGWWWWQDLVLSGCGLRGSAPREHR